MHRPPWILLTLLVVAIRPAGAMQGGAQLPDAPGKAIFEKACGTCHSTNDAVARRRTRTAWEQVVDDMRVTIEELNTLRRSDAQLPHSALRFRGS